MVRLSVILPVRNGRPYLEEAVESVLSQLGPEDEFLVRDDGSDDGTLEDLRTIVDRRLTLQTGRPVGLAASLNELLAAARGRYVARMDADDVSLPGRFDSQIDELESGGFDLLSSARCRIGERGEILVEEDPEFDAKHLNRFNGFTHGSWLFRRELVDEGWRYDESWETAQDYELLLRLKGAGKKLAISETVTYHQRVHPDSLTQTSRRKQLRAMLLAQQKYWETCGGTASADAELAITRWRLGMRLGVVVPLLRCLLAGDIAYPIREIRYYHGNPDNI